MICKTLFNTIEAFNQKYLSIWEDVCNLESPTTYKKGVDAVGSYFAALAEKQGWEIEIFPQEQVGDVVCITMNPYADAKPITLSGHIDTVHPVGSFGTPAVRTDEKNIYGPGVMDCKGGVVAAFLAMDALAECGFPKRPVRLLLQTDEENNSMLSHKQTINYICEKAKDSVAFLNCESSRPGSVVLERKGIVRYRLTVFGKEIHSSRCAEGASAIAEAAHKILKLERFKDQDGLTCNCGIISGGVAENTVPKQCTFYADIRFSTAKELEQIQEEITRIANTNEVPGCTCLLEETGFRPAMELTQKNTDLFETINRIFEENQLPVLKSRKSLGGSDAADVTTRGIPCVDSIGVEGDFIHTTKEFAVLDSLKEAAKRIAAIVFSI